MHRNFIEQGGSEHFQNSVEKPKKTKEALSAFMKDIAMQINKEAYNSHGINGLLDSEGQIKAQGYTKIHSQELIDESIAQVREREAEFSDASHPGTQKFYKETYGIEGEDAIIDQWKKEKKENKNYQLELLVTALLHKILNDRYFVVRTSEYDDYHNGIDNLIIDKESGVVVCAFDEVHEGGTGQRTEVKQEKIAKIARKGGAEIRFGLSFENGTLKRASLENLPVFYLGLTTNELIDLTQEMSYDFNGEISDQERNIYIKLIDSVEDQLKGLLKEKLPAEVKTNLENFKNSFDALRNYPK